MKREIKARIWFVLIVLCMVACMIPMTASDVYAQESTQIGPIALTLENWEPVDGQSAYRDSSVIDAQLEAYGCHTWGAVNWVDKTNKVTLCDVSDTEVTFEPNTEYELEIFISRNRDNTKNLSSSVSDYTLNGNGASSLRYSNGNRVIVFSFPATKGVSTPLTNVSVSGSAQVGEALTAEVNPSGAHADYQWYKEDALGQKTAIDGATNDTYYVALEDAGCRFFVKATGRGAYKDTVTSSLTKAVPEVEAKQVTGVTIVGEARLNETLTASVSPADATVDYEWYEVKPSGEEVLMTYATTAKYRITKYDDGSRFYVKAIGKGIYTGTVTSDVTDVVEVITEAPLALTLTGWVPVCCETVQRDADLIEAQLAQINCTTGGKVEWQDVMTGETFAGVGDTEKTFGAKTVYALKIYLDKTDNNNLSTNKADYTLNGVAANKLGITGKGVVISFYFPETGDHDYAETVTTEPACANVGEKVITCHKCAYKCIEEIEKLPHTYDAGVVTTPATYDADGVRTYTCTACQDTKTEVIPKIVKETKPEETKPEETKSEETKPEQAEPKDTVKVGKVYKISKNKAKVKVTSKKSRTVEYVGPMSKKGSKVTIPSTVKIDGKTYKVTSIAKNAFKNNSYVKSVTIGKYVKTIGKRAFYGCKKLKTITINTKKLTTKTVGKQAFKGTPKSVRVKVPKSKYKAYKKLLISKGIYKKAKIKK